MKIKWIAMVVLLGCVLTLPSPSRPQTSDQPKVYKVAILPFLIHSQENLDYLREGIYDILASRVIVEGRIEVIDRSLVERTLFEERPMRLDESAAQNIGAKVGADFVVLGSLTKVGDYISLDARLINIAGEKAPLGVYTQHKGIDDVMVKIGDFAQEIGNKILGRRATAARPSEGKSPFLAKPRREIGRVRSGDIGYKQSQTFNFEVKGIDVGDVDGDKKNELVVMDVSNLYVFKYDGEKLTLFQKIEAGHENNFLSIDVADLNKNGHAEIIVTSVVEDDLRSFILEYEEGRFRKITEKAGWFFRVLHHPKDGPILLGQQCGSEGLAVNPVYRMVWKKKSFEKGPKMRFPNDTTIYGVTMADLRGNGKPDFITVDKYDRLNIHSEDGKVQWRSTDKFGGTNNFYETQKKGDYTLGRNPPPWREFVPGRILVKDLEGTGVPQVIINKNEFGAGRVFEKIKVYEKGEIHGLVWEENDLVTEWKTRQIKGYIADFQVMDVDNDGNPELIVAVVAPAIGDVSGVLSRKSLSNIYFFKLF
jgi:TolB-like protein